MKNSVAKGPIRTGVVAPAVVLSILIYGYFHFLFDHHLRRGFEYIGTRVVGAEVDVGRVRTNFFTPSFEVDDIQVTDSHHPERDLIRLGQIKFALKWNALLRAKIMIEEAAIEKIAALVPRDRPGIVLPPPPPAPGPSLASNVERQVLDQTAQQYDGNFLGDLAGVLRGGDLTSALKGVEGHLKSEARVQALLADLKVKRGAWEQRIRTLPQAPEFKAFGERIKALKFDLGKPAEIAENLKKADQIRREAEAKLKILAAANQDVNHDLSEYHEALKSLPTLVAGDIQDLRARFKIPNLDAKEFSRQIFMHFLREKLGGFGKWVDLARRYMPTKKAAPKAAYAPAPPNEEHRRGGRTYRFPITAGYPLFWLKHAGLSSSLGQSENSGEFRGDLRDVTSDPVYLGRPMILTAAGNFPEVHLSGVNLKVTVDHTAASVREALLLAVDQFPVATLKLSESPEASLSFDSSSTAGKFTAELNEDILAVETNAEFRQAHFDAHARDQNVEKILRDIVADIGAITVNASVGGPLNALGFKINSNLGDKMAQGFKKVLNAKLSGAEAQLNQFVQSRLGQPTAELRAQIDKLLGPIAKQIGIEQSGSEKITAETKNVGGSAAKAPAKQLEEQGKKLLKSFGF